MHFLRCFTPDSGIRFVQVCGFEPFVLLFVFKLRCFKPVLGLWYQTEHFTSWSSEEDIVEDSRISSTERCIRGLFVDLGAGRGTALAAAAMYGFQRVAGIEIEQGW